MKINFAKKCIIILKNTTPTNPIRQSLLSDDETSNSPTYTEGRDKKKVSFSSDSDCSDRDHHLYSLLHQNLDASLHALFYSPSLVSFLFYGNMLYSLQIFPHRNYHYSLQFY